ncbi:WD domain, G-beta repeat domain containing protein, partial [Reticulomyxa filosa]
MSVNVFIRFKGEKSLTKGLSTKSKHLRPNSQRNYVRVDDEFNLYYTNVLPIKAKQEDVFDAVQPLISDFFDGKNCCVIAHGAPASGKTYTNKDYKTTTKKKKKKKVFGTGDEHTRKNGVIHLGLLPRFVSSVLDQLSQLERQNHGVFSYSVDCSFAELYNVICPFKKHILTIGEKKKKKKKTDKAIDLLNLKNRDTVTLLPRKNDEGYEWYNLTKVSIRQISDLLKYMHTSFNNRKYVLRYNAEGVPDPQQFRKDSTVAPHWEASRSHTICVLRLSFR